MHEEYEVQLFRLIDFIRERGLEGCFSEEAVEDAIEALRILVAHLPENPDLLRI